MGIDRFSDNNNNDSHSDNSRNNDNHHGESRDPRDGNGEWEADTDTGSVTDADSDAATRAMIDATETVPLTHAIIAPDLWAALETRFALSGRELEILQAVFDGERNARIAFRTNLSRHTIRSYIRRIYQKTGTTDRPELILAIMAAVLRLQASPPEDPDPGSGTPGPAPGTGGGPGTGGPTLKDAKGTIEGAV